MALLTRAELADLTGTRDKHAQVEALRGQGIPYVLRVDGWPVTTWQAVEARLAAARADRGPRWEALAK